MSGWRTSNARVRCRPWSPALDGPQRLTDTYRYFHHLPLRDSADALYVDWCELTTTDAAGRVLYRNSWATSHKVTAETVVALAAVGRSRWKIENENNNTLKTKGYHFEHNYGHGKQHLSAVLATLIILAYLVHTVLDCLDQRYRAVRALLPRQTFFEHLRAFSSFFTACDRRRAKSGAGQTPGRGKFGIGAPSKAWAESGKMDIQVGNPAQE